MNGAAKENLLKAAEATAHFNSQADLREKTILESNLRQEKLLRQILEAVKKLNNHG